MGAAIALLAGSHFSQPRVTARHLRLQRGIARPEVSPEWLIPRRHPAPLTEELRRRGYNECNPHDPLGLGPYQPYTKVKFGRLTIPQRGGHSDDYGYDVLVHFHGHDPMRKILAQVSRGMAYVGVDMGLGSGPYADAFLAKESFAGFRASIERGLKKASGVPSAHIRHLALCAWSAGYGAINEILKHGDDGIDAVVLLDGLHARFDPASPPGRRQRKVLADFIEPTFRFAERAAKGEKIFIFSHSEIDPGSYPSTALTAQALLHRIGVEPVAQQADGLFTIVSRADRNGLHVWGSKGGDELAHCAHITLIEDVLGEILEPTWHTPLMDRDVPPTPAPKLGGPSRAASHEACEEPSAGGARFESLGGPDHAEPSDSPPDEELPSAG